MTQGGQIMVGEQATMNNEFSLMVDSIRGRLSPDVIQTRKEAIEHFGQLYIQLINVDSTQQPWCIDGRADQTKDSKGIQMPGGSLFPILLRAIYESKDGQSILLNADFVSQSVTDLSVTDPVSYQTGVHYGSHRHGNHSDCGFADRMPEIFQKAVDQQAEIVSRLAEQALVQPEFVSESTFKAVKHAYEIINLYQASNLTLTGEPLVRTMIDQGATLTNLEGDHQEMVAYVNTQPRTSLDTNAMNAAGHQGFNFDVWAVQEQAEKLGIHDPEFVLGSSLIFYLATEMVLVEEKKPAVTVVIR